MPPASLTEMVEEEALVGPATAKLFQAHAEEVWRFLKYLGVSRHEMLGAQRAVLEAKHDARDAREAREVRDAREVSASPEVQA